MNTAVVDKDVENKTMTVKRTFNAQKDAVWTAWTQSDLLEKWWAPKPWKAGTESFEFKEGGHWHYYMLGPDGEKSWAWFSYDAIDPKRSFEGEDYFCDETGKKNEEFPTMHWKTEFTEAGDATHVLVTITFPTREAMDKTLEMGMEEGFTMALGNLEEVLEKGI